MRLMQRRHQSQTARRLPNIAGIILGVIAFTGAVDLIARGQLPWPDGYFADPGRQQMLVTLVLTVVLVGTLNEIIRRFPAPEESSEQ
jgi:hypothetical protein